MDVAERSVRRRAEHRDADDGRERGAGGLTLPVAEPEDEQRHDDGPPPTPKRALKAPAAVAITASRASLDDIARHTTGGVRSPAETLAESLRPLTEDPSSAAVFCDIDGTLAPIVRRPENSHVKEEVSLLLGKLGRTYGRVACVSGRPAAEARRLVGVEGASRTSAPTAPSCWTPVRPSPSSSTPSSAGRDACARFVEGRQADRDA